MIQGLGLFVIPILSGYLFLTKLNYTKFEILKESGYHVLFRSALLGFILLTASNGIKIMLLNYEHVGLAFDFVEKLVPIDNAVTLSFTLLLGYLLPIPFNRRYSEKIASRKTAKENGDMIELLIDDSVHQEFAIHLTLRSGKCYIGMVVESQFIWPDDSDFALIPIASGYRDKDTQELVVTTYYVSIIEEIKAKEDGGNIDDIRIVIPMSEIVSARPFDIDIYNRVLEKTPTST